MSAKGSVAPGSWRDRARQVIAQVHAGLPKDASDEARKAALSAAYPFGERKYTPYKTWLQECKDYMGRYSTNPPVLYANLQALADSPYCAHPRR